MAAPVYANSANALIRKALRDAGRLQPGDDPSSDVLADAMSRLTDLINAYQTQGLKLWVNATQSVTLVAGTASYTLGPGGAIISTKPTRVLNGWYVDSSGSRRELGLPLSWTDFRALGNLTTQGAVTSYHVDKQRSNLALTFWHVPDSTAAAGTVELLIQRQVPTPEALTDDVEFPREWYLALRWGLADDLCTGQPIPIMQRCEARAREYRAMLEDWDVEDASTRFLPSAPVGGARRSRFA